MGKDFSPEMWSMTVKTSIWPNTDRIRYFLGYLCHTDIKPLYATASYSVKFAFFFATYTASVSHVLLFNHKQVWSGIKSAFSRKTRLRQQNDVHNRLMASYPEVPQWWFMIIFAISFAMGAGALAKWLPEAPIWVSMV
jgi:hypothetical protein